MPSNKFTKTYERKNTSVSSVSLYGAIKNRPLKRKKKKIVIPELPIRKKTESFLLNDSLHVSVEDSFDKLKARTNTTNNSVTNFSFLSVNIKNNNPFEISKRWNYGHVYCKPNCCHKKVSNSESIHISVNGKKTNISGISIKNQLLCSSNSLNEFSSLSIHQSVELLEADTGRSRDKENKTSLSNRSSSEFFSPKCYRMTRSQKKKILQCSSNSEQLSDSHRNFENLESMISDSAEANEVEEKKTNYVYSDSSVSNYRKVSPKSKCYEYSDKNGYVLTRRKKLFLQPVINANDFSDSSNNNKPTVLRSDKVKENTNYSCSDCSAMSTSINSRKIISDFTFTPSNDFSDSNRSFQDSIDEPISKSEVSVADCLEEDKTHYSDLVTTTKEKFRKSISRDYIMTRSRRKRSLSFKKRGVVLDKVEENQIMTKSDSDNLLIEKSKSSTLFTNSDSSVWTKSNTDQFLQSANISDSNLVDIQTSNRFINNDQENHIFKTKKNQLLASNKSWDSSYLSTCNFSKTKFMAHTSTPNKSLRVCSNDELQKPNLPMNENSLKKGNFVTKRRKLKLNIENSSSVVEKCSHIKEKKFEEFQLDSKFEELHLNKSTVISSVKKCIEFIPITSPTSTMNIKNGLLGNISRHNFDTSQLNTSISECDSEDDIFTTHSESDNKTRHTSSTPVYIKNKQLQVNLCRYNFDKLQLNTSASKADTEKDKFTDHADNCNKKRDTMSAMLVIMKNKQLQVNLSRHCFDQSNTSTRTVDLEQDKFTATACSTPLTGNNKRLINLPRQTFGTFISERNITENQNLVNNLNTLEQEKFEYSPIQDSNLSCSLNNTYNSLSLEVSVSGSIVNQTIPLAEKNNILNTSDGTEKDVSKSLFSFSDQIKDKDLLFSLSDSKYDELHSNVSTDTVRLQKYKENIPSTSPSPPMIINKEILDGLSRHNQLEVNGSTTTPGKNDNKIYSILSLTSSTNEEDVEEDSYVIHEENDVIVNKEILVNESRHNFDQLEVNGSTNNGGDYKLTIPEKNDNKIYSIISLTSSTNEDDMEQDSYVIHEENDKQINLRVPSPLKSKQLLVNLSRHTYDKLITSLHDEDMEKDTYANHGKNDYKIRSITSSTPRTNKNKLLINSTRHSFETFTPDSLNNVTDQHNLSGNLTRFTEDEFQDSSIKDSFISSQMNISESTVNSTIPTGEHDDLLNISDEFKNTALTKSIKNNHLTSKTQKNTDNRSNEDYNDTNTLVEPSVKSEDLFKRILEDSNDQSVNISKNHKMGFKNCDNIIIDLTSPLQRANSFNNKSNCNLSFVRPSIQLKGGKTWKRLYSLYKRNSFIGNTLDTSCKEENCNHEVFQSSIRNASRRFTHKFIPVNLVSTQSIGNEEKDINKSYVPQQILEDPLEHSFRNLSLKNNRLNNGDEHPIDEESAKDIVLKKCGQAKPLEFSKCFPNSVLQHCQKIGEGLYGEVFLFRNPSGGTSVIKIIPVEGEQLVNGEKQKKFQEILSEILITIELSNLRYNRKNGINTFAEVQKVLCVQGRYPEKLIDLWDLYEENKGSENDRPDIFDESQLYIVFQMAYAGKDLESYTFNNAVQFYSAFQQISIALAVAEQDLQFEHRDLHWGNVLIDTIDDNQSKMSFNLNEKEFQIPLKGIKVAIIDYSLSRIKWDGLVIFNDLALDPDLFTADGDYQFQIYRLMQQKNRNDWKSFEPYTNLLWLHYILDKSITAIRYKNKKSKIHNEYMDKLRMLKEEVLTYNNMTEFVSSTFLNC